MAAIDDELSACRARCGPYLARLALLAGSPPSAPLPAGAATDVAVAVDAILVQVEAAGRVVMSSAAGSQRTAIGEFLTARLVRLETAAGDAITAAYGGDATVLRARLRQFDTLTTALWTVQQAVAIPAPRPSMAAVSRDHAQSHGPVQRPGPLRVSRVSL